MNNNYNNNMIFGIGVFSYAIFSTVKSSGWKTWTEICKPQATWEEYPVRQSTIQRCNHAN